MAIETRSPFWGLVVQNGPWPETPLDLEHKYERDIKWQGGGVPAGGREHAGHAEWYAQLMSVTGDNFGSQSYILPPPPMNVIDNGSLARAPMSRSQISGYEYPEGKSSDWVKEYGPMIRQGSELAASILLDNTPAFLAALGNARVAATTAAAAAVAAVRKAVGTPPKAPGSTITPAAEPTTLSTPAPVGAAVGGPTIPTSTPAGFPVASDSVASVVMPGREDTGDRPTVTGRPTLSTKDTSRAVAAFDHAKTPTAGTLAAAPAETNSPSGQLAPLTPTQDRVEGLASFRQLVQGYKDNIGSAKTAGSARELMSSLPGLDATVAREAEKAVVTIAKIDDTLMETAISVLVFYMLTPDGQGIVLDIVQQLAVVYKMYGSEPIGDIPSALAITWAMLEPVISGRGPLGFIGRFANVAGGYATQTYA